MLQTWTVETQTAAPVIVAGEDQMLAARKRTVMEACAHLPHRLGARYLKDLEKNIDKFWVEVMGLSLKHLSPFLCPRSWHVYHPDAAWNSVPCVASGRDFDCATRCVPCFWAAAAQAPGQMSPGSAGLQTFSYKTRRWYPADLAEYQSDPHLRSQRPTPTPCPHNPWLNAKKNAPLWNHMNCLHRLTITGARCAHEGKGFSAAGNSVRTLSGKDVSYYVSGIQQTCIVHRGIVDGEDQPIQRDVIL